MGPFDKSGWHANAKPTESPNQDKRPARVLPELLVIHGISVPEGEFGGTGVSDLFLNNSNCPSLAGLEVSAHFFIRRKGELIQFVPCARRAWHAGASSWDNRPSCNDFSIGIELEGTDNIPYESEQYETLGQLVNDIRSAYPSLCAIAGHSDIAPGRKSDPGNAFDWGRLFDSVGWHLDGRDKGPG